MIQDGVELGLMHLKHGLGFCTDWFLKRLACMELKKKSFKMLIPIQKTDLITLKRQRYS